MLSRPPEGGICHRFSDRHPPVVSLIYPSYASKHPHWGQRLHRGKYRSSQSRCVHCSSGMGLGLRDRPVSLVGVPVPLPCFASAAHVEFPSSFFPLVRWSKAAAYQCRKQGRRMAGGSEHHALWSGRSYFRMSSPGLLRACFVRRYTLRRVSAVLVYNTNGAKLSATRARLLGVRHRARRKQRADHTPAGYRTL